MAYMNGNEVLFSPIVSAVAGITPDSAVEYFANALKGEARGEVVALDDVTPFPVKVKAKVCSQNIIPYPYAQTTRTESGITFTDNGDGSISVKGTATANSVFYIYDDKGKGCDFISIGEYYSKSANGAVDGLYFSVNYYRTSRTNNNYSQWFNTNTAKAPIDFDGAIMYLVVLSGTTVDTVVYPMLNHGATANSYKPPIADEAWVTVKTCRKNILPYPYLHSTMTTNGITFTDNGDGSINIKGTATENATFYIWERMYFPNGFKVGQTYRISAGNFGNDSSFASFCINYMDKDGITFTGCVVNSKGNTIAWTIPEEAVGLLIYVVVLKGTTIDHTIYPQVEIGAEAASLFEPYIEGETISAKAGEIVELDGILPNMTICTGTNGAVLDVVYKRDINKAFKKIEQAIISLGGNV